MKDFTFHAEMPSERRSKSANKSFPHFPWTRKALQEFADAGGQCNVCAMVTDRTLWRVQNGEIMREGFTSVFDHPNSDVNWSAASGSYLRQRTTRISEALARQLHPALFNRLDG